MIRNLLLCLLLGVYSHLLIAQTQSCDPPCGDLVSNGDFEINTSLDICGWKYAYFGSGPGPSSYAGNDFTSLYVQNNNYGVNDAIITEEPLNLIPGQSYTLSFDYGTYLIATNNLDAIVFALTDQNDYPYDAMAQVTDIPQMILYEHTDVQETTSSQSNLAPVISVQDIPITAPGDPNYKYLLVYGMKNTQNGGVFLALDNVSIQAKNMLGCDGYNAAFSALGFPGNTSIDICNGQELSFLMDNPTPPDPLVNYNYTWSVNEAGAPLNVLTTNVAETAYNYTFSAPGTYEVNLSLNNCIGCEDTYSITVNVSADDICEIDCPSIICEGDNVTYTAACDCPVYNWQFIVDGVVIHSASGNPVNVDWTGLPTDHSGYGVIVLETPGCPNHSCGTSIASVPIIPENVSISGPELVCSSTNALQYSVPFWAGANYTWSVVADDGSNIDWVDNGNSISVNLAPDYNRNFTVSVDLGHNFLGCTVSASMSVISYSTSIAGENVYCANDPINLSLSDPQPGQSYEWTIVDASGNPVSGCNGSGSTFSCSSGLAAGNYTVSIGVLIGGDPVSCSFSNFSITVNENLPITDSDIIGERTICAGIPYTYSINNTNPDATVYWEFIGAEPEFAIGNEATVIWIAGNEPYAVKIYKEVEGCPYQEFVVNIEAEEPPALTVDGSDNVCVDSREDYVLNLTGIPYDDAEYINWTTQAGVGSIIAGQGTNTVEIEWHQEGMTAVFTETIEVEVLVCGITYFYTLEVEVNQRPDIEIIAEDAGCEGENISFVSNISGATYSWTLEDGTVIGTTAGLLYTFDDYGSYNVQLTISDIPNCPGTFTAFHLIDILPAPDPYISSIGGIDPSDCPLPTYFTTIDLFTEANPNYTYQWWYFPEGGTGWAPISGATGPAYTVVINNAATDPGYGDYRVHVTSGDCVGISNIYMANCVTDVPCEVSVIPEIIGYFFNDDCGSIVAKGTVDLFDLANYDYFWRVVGFDGTITLIDDDGNSFDYQNLLSYEITEMSNLGVTFNFTEPGFYPLELIVEGQVAGEDCSSFALEVIEIPIIPDYRYEIGDCTSNPDGSLNVNFIDISEAMSVDPPGTTPITWTSYWEVIGSDGSIQDGQDMGGVFAAVLVPGITYTVSMVVNTDYTNNGDLQDPYSCSAKSITITLPDADADFTFMPSPVCIGDAITFSPVMDADFVDSYHWDFGDGSTISSGLRNPSYTYASAGDKEVTLTIITSFGCTLSMTKTIQVAPTPSGAIAPNLGCSNVVLCYVALTSETITAYQWSTGATTGCIEVSTPGYYRVTVTNDMGCTSIATYTLSETFNVDYSISGPNEVCITDGSEAFTYSVNSYGIETYQWDAPGLSNTASDPNEFTTQFPGPGVYNITATIMQGTEVCAVNTIKVNVNLVPTLDLLVSTSCDPYSATVVEQAGLLVDWYADGELVLAASNTLTTAIPGIYQATFSQNGCSATQTVIVPEGNLDFSTFLTGCYEVCPEELTISDCIPGIEGEYDSWEWKYIDDGTISSFDPPVNGGGSVSDFCLTEDMFDGSNSLEVVLELVSEAGCLQTSEAISFEAISCDSSCLDVKIENILCYNNGTQTPDDDYWTFDMTVTGGTPGSYWTTSGLNPEESGPYDETKTIWMGAINGMGGTTLNFYVFDALDTCGIDVNVEIPAACSDTCKMEAFVTSIDCDKEKAGQYYVTLNVTGTSSQCWMAKQKIGTVENVLGSWTGDQTVTLGPFSSDDGDWTLWVMVCEQFECVLDFYIQAPDCKPKYCNIKVDGQGFCGCLVADEYAFFEVDLIGNDCSDGYAQYTILTPGEFYLPGTGTTTNTYIDQFLYQGMIGTDDVYRSYALLPFNDHNGEEVDNCFLVELFDENNVLYHSEQICYDVDCNGHGNIGNREDLHIEKNEGQMLIMEDALFEKAMVHPNPSNGTFKLALPDNKTIEQMYVLDINGKVLPMPQSIDALSGKQLDFDLNLPAGVYFMKIQYQDQQIETIRFVVQ